MKQYDVTCPICGTVNKNLYLDETGGWMICEKCDHATLNMNYAVQHMKKIPLYRMNDEPLYRPSVGCAV